MVAILFLLVIYVTMVYGPIAAALVEMFPTSIRYTSMSLPYHIGNGWFGGFLPTTAFAMVAATGNIYYGLWYPVVVALVTVVVGFLFIRDRKEKEAPHRIEKQPVMALEQARNTLRGLRKQLENWSSLDDIRAALSETTPEVPGRSVTASVFSAALELTRDGEVELRQDAHFAPLYLRNAARAGEGLDATA